jgi:hypothetical protein
MSPEDMEFHRNLYFGIAKCIASVDPEYQAGLCRDFRINPKDVAAAALTRPQREGKVCGYHDGCPPDGPVCHLCEHLQT